MAGASVAFNCPLACAHMPPSMLDAFGLLRLTPGWCLIGSEPKMPPGWLDALLLRRAEGSGCSGADESSKVKASLRTMGAPAQAIDWTSTRGVDTGRDTGASTWLWPPKMPPSSDDLVMVDVDDAATGAGPPKMPPSIELAPRLCAWTGAGASLVPKMPAPRWSGRPERHGQGREGTYVGREARVMGEKCVRHDRGRSTHRPGCWSRCACPT
jgi:hypothetical protein